MGDYEKFEFWYHDTSIYKLKKEEYLSEDDEEKNTQIVKNP
jgi:hypothetical protein